MESNRKIYLLMGISVAFKYEGLKWAAPVDAHQLVFSKHKIFSGVFGISSGTQRDVKTYN